MYVNEHMRVFIIIYVYQKTLLFIYAYAYIYIRNIPSYISSHVCLLKGARMYVKDVFGQG